MPNMLFLLAYFIKKIVDSICKGDGLRALHCRHFSLPLYMSANRKNYALKH